MCYSERGRRSCGDSNPHQPPLLRLTRTPLPPLVTGLRACAAGDLETAQRLRSEGGWAAAHATDKFGSSALMWAASFGHVHVARWLCGEAGADVDARNKQGRTALMFAAKVR